MIILLIVLLGTPIEGRNCSESNGGCQHYCIDRNDANIAFCGCQCYYQLDQDGQTCSLINECGVDMLWMFDFTEGVLSYLGCTAVKFGFPPSDPVPFETWRDATASYIQAFNNEINSSTYHIATIVSGFHTMVTNNYTDLQDANALQAEIQAIQPSRTTICGSISVFGELHTIANGGSDLVLGGRRDSATATQVAVVTMIAPLSTNAESTLTAYTDKIHEDFDHVFVIGKKDISLLDSNTFIQEHLRWLACRNGTATNCPYLFFTDGLNDNNATFTGPHVNPMIDRSKCLSRRPTFEHSVDCGIAVVTITIPICILGGLEQSDLQLNDPACDISTKSQIVGEDLVITISYDECSWTQTPETIGSYQYVTYSQAVTRRATGTPDSAKLINLGATCRFLRYSEEDLGPVAPIEEAVTAEVVVNATFDVEFLLYENDSYISPYSSLPSEIPIFERLYFAVKATIPSDLKLILTGLEARNSADRSSGISYDIVASQCSNDDTFRFESIINDDVKQFSFEMFEFASTANSPNDQKDPVYFFAAVFICPTNDTNVACTQTCTSGKRKKRDAEDNGENAKHIRRLGPFFMGEPVNQKKDEVVKPKRDDKDNIVVTIEMEDPSYIELSCLWMFITLVAILIVTTITKFLMKCSQHKTPEFYKSDIKDKEMNNLPDIKNTTEPKL